jgi:hypothetical protein
MAKKPITTQMAADIARKYEAFRIAAGDIYHSLIANGADFCLNCGAYQSVDTLWPNNRCLHCGTPARLVSARGGALGFIARGPAIIPGIGVMPANLNQELLPLQVDNKTTKEALKNE